MRHVVAVGFAWAVGCTGAVGNDLDPGADEETSGIRRAEPQSEDFAPVDAVVRRLTQYEYAYTIQDVLGVVLPPAERARVPADRPLEGFANIATGQTTLPDHVRAYAAVADYVVSSMEFSDFLETHAGCQEATPECGRAFVESAGKILFRRPLSSEEVDDFSDLFSAVVSEDAGFAEAARWVTTGMLQSPQFLYLLEVTRVDDFEGLRAVDGYEMASRLSYLLWASAPDAALYEAAEGGGLDTREGVLAQADRMLRDTEKTQRVAERFLVDWARLEALPDDDGLRSDRIAAGVAFYLDHVQNGRPLFDLLRAPRAFLTPDLAEGLGLNPAGNGIQEYDLTSTPNRLGLLSQPGVIAGMTNADGGEIVARGLFLQQQLFCGDIPDPPATLQEAIDEFVEAQPDDASDRQIAETRLMRPECAACHAQFDPLAYGFEHFDYQGRFREVDEHGNPVAIDGWIPESLAGGDRLNYADFESYMSLLVENERVRHCLTQRQLEYALASRLDSRHGGSIAELEDLAQGDGRLETLLLALVEHDLFRLVQMEQPQ